MKKEVFGFLSDLSPDRWGRKLIQCLLAENSDISSFGQRRRLLESDYVCSVSDRTRQGGIRLSENVHFLSDIFGMEQSIPAITSLKELETASLQFEKYEGNNTSKIHIEKNCDSS